ncbi:MAG: tetratricopeptide repeat protein, partial [Bacteroidia bacterium]
MMKKSPPIRILAFSCLLILISTVIFSQDSKPNAALILEKILNEQSIEEAQQTFEKILTDSTQYVLLENELNALGYQLTRQRKFDEAIAVFKMNVQAFPGSWNVYDSLGEILAWTGDTESAIKNFEKSLELNPENENALRNLNQIYGDISDHEMETKAEFEFAHSTSTGLMEPFFGEEPPGLTPKLFAPGIISTHGHFEFACTFSPDGKEFYFTRRADEGGRNVIMVSKWEADGWTAPDTADFSKEGGDHEPHISPDGKNLYFGTTRIKPGEDSPSYGIWIMHRTETGWSEPEFAAEGMYASSTLDGSIYVTDISDQTEGGIIKLSRKEDGFQAPVRLGGGVNTPENGIHPFIAPDERFVLFDCQ